MHIFQCELVFFVMMNGYNYRKLTKTFIAVLEKISEGNMDFRDFADLITLILCIVGIIGCIVSIPAHAKWLKENFPPLIDFCDAEGIAKISVYEERGRYGEKSAYKEFTFIRKPSGRWVYKNKKMMIIVLLCAIPVLILSIFWFSQLGLGAVDDMVIFAFFWTLLVLALSNLETLKARRILKKYLQGNLKADADGKLKENVPVDPEETKRREEAEQESQKKNYDVLAPILNGCVRIIRFLIWFGIFFAFLIAFGTLAFELYSLINEKESFLMLYIMVAVGMMMTGIFMCFWIRIRKTMMGDHSLVIPLNKADRSNKYAPEVALKKLADNHYNVIIVKDMDAMIRIYGEEDKHVLEIEIGAKEDLHTYHMVKADKMESTMIVPDTDEAMDIIKNKWEEFFPVRTEWLVSNDMISSFLRKVYDYKNIQDAMKGFLFEDTTEETRKLIAADAYSVPAIPVKMTFRKFSVELWAEGLKRKIVLADRALGILSKDLA